MSRRITTLTTLAIAVLAALAALAPAASAAPAPAWQITLRSQQTNFKPGQEAKTQAPKYLLLANNVGAAASAGPAGPITVTIELPDGVSLAAGKSPSGSDQTDNKGTSCAADGQTITCTNANSIDPGEWLRVEVPVEVANLPEPSVLSASATISGGGGGVASAEISTTVSNATPGFGFLAGHEGLNAAAVEEDGAAATQAGSHPHRLTVNFGMPTALNAGGGNVIPAGTLDDAKVDLPAGMIVDPSATEKCSEAQLISASCPDSSQVGIATVPLTIGDPANRNLYNMEPPPGYAGSFGFTFGGVPVHILGGVRPGDYRITSLSPDAISVLAIFAARIQLWGLPSDESHDAVRGICGKAGSKGPDGKDIPADATCPVTRSTKPLISLPTSCTDEMQIDAHVSLWEEPGVFHSRAVELSDANGDPTEVSGCEQLRFSPTMRARPTTDLADSPTGLEFDLGVPQSDDVGALATAHLKKAVVTLPEGLVINPASANGLESCDPEEIGIDQETGVADGDPVGCPAASRIGKVEVDTPLLDHTLPGSVYVATPHQNPFDSLLAIYIVVDDPSTGTLVKLAAHVIADPQTGRITAISDNAPQIPFEHFRLDFFGGPSAALRTPSTCGSYATSSEMTPWSAPDSGPAATPSDDYAISRGPAGACATTPGSQPHSPEFSAGSVSPIAAKHSDFVLRLRREDGSQQFSAVDVKPPPGLLAKLAGTPSCSEEALAAAAQKAGGAEQANPSCPDASRVGTVHVAAGAGPAPYWAQGTAYLSGPYKGAPLSAAIITPAVAGPYDLGTVVVRSPVYVDPISAAVTVKSDPIPQILAGIPVDVRAVEVNLDKPQFTLNPTSCDPMAISADVRSILGGSAPLSQRFQVAGCRELRFAPRLQLRLKGGTKRGGHPSLRAVLSAKKGEANIARTIVALPRSAFLDQGHIRTVCTRVQFAADNCPKGAIYGRVRATTPLLEEPLVGPVYLRSSDNELPDMVAVLKGPPSRPIEIEAVARIDSTRGGIRANFETIPDAPISKVIVTMQGGRKGLLINSTNLCAKRNRASVQMDAHNGMSHDFRPVVKAKCGKRRSAHRRR